MKEVLLWIFLILAIVWLVGTVGQHAAFEHQHCLAAGGQLISTPDGTICVRNLDIVK